MSMRHRGESKEDCSFLGGFAGRIMGREGSGKQPAECKALPHVGVGIPGTWWRIGAGHDGDESYQRY